MAQVEGPVSFVLPSDVGIDAVIEALGRDVEVVADGIASTDRVYLDTFDGRVDGSGLTLWRSPSTAKDPTVRLTLEDRAGATRSVIASPSRPDRVLALEVEEEASRDRLESVVGERALIGQVRVRSRVRRLAVCDAEGKTVTRVAIEDPTVVLPKRGSVALERRLHVVAVLGYGRAFSRVLEELTGKIGLRRAAAPLADEAKIAAGVPVGGVSSKVDVELDPGMRADHASALICRRLARTVEANLPGTLADVDPEFLHDLRVAVRRTRSVLKEMKHVLPPEETARARADLRWIQEITGSTRDLDVQLQAWPVMVSTVTPALAIDLPPLRDLLERHRAAAFVRMRRYLQGARFKKAWASWWDFLDGPFVGQATVGTPIAEVAGHRIAAVYKTMVNSGAAIDDKAPPEALHDLRKRGKELRYLLELFGGLWPSDTVKPLVSTLKDLQDVLGRFQDDEVQTVYLRQLGPELAALPGGTDSLIALGLVIDDLASDQQRAREEFAKNFAPFAAADTRNLVRATFGRRAARASRSSR
ncbi:MAG: CHAD domain-containing protein [Actinobacteria bacterium]|nr:CHAD domain-containing protein [Actinomycetota bacterium]